MAVSSRALILQDSAADLVLFAFTERINEESPLEGRSLRVRRNWLNTLCQGGPPSKIKTYREFLNLVYAHTESTTRSSLQNHVGA